MSEDHTTKKEFSIPAYFKKEEDPVDNPHLTDEYRKKLEEVMPEIMRADNDPPSLEELLKIHDDMREPLQLTRKVYYAGHPPEGATFNRLLRTEHGRELMAQLLLNSFIEEMIQTAREAGQSAVEVEDV